jgi:hypothetical protein
LSARRAAGVQPVAAVPYQHGPVADWLTGASMSRADQGCAAAHSSGLAIAPPRPGSSTTSRTNFAPAGSDAAPPTTRRLT